MHRHSSYTGLPEFNKLRLPFQHTINRQKMILKMWKSSINGGIMTGKNWKHCGRSRKCSFWAMFYLCHNVYTRRLLQRRQKASTWGKGLIYNFILHQFMFHLYILFIKVASIQTDVKMQKHKFTMSSLCTGATSIKMPPLPSFKPRGFGTEHPGFDPQYQRSRRSALGQGTLPSLLLIC